ncbi:putative methylmalonyl-CoA mutase, small subunit [Aeromicrobium marinum DSM 15272]|uniref:Methylmalonyl-CoA mutase, small subunit n=1 Tax=Aeromicrobium marinum DSM 15272 TaxID=585531 RepID=E2SDG5_9ACTN|nr:methylmalonyl-CoA mutase subunit beta [Aeromicrobium marinum]EFQ82542.1 putative methylmalonyl-CoA mutase, small subunit [Aeromicrobium marinum DSM 15272]
MAAESSSVAPDPTVPLADGLDATREQWEKATAAVLRKSRRLADDAPDGDVWTELTSTTLDGIAVSPLGTPAETADLPDPGLPGQAPFTRGTAAAREHQAWDIRAWFTDPDGDRTAEHVMTDLENGVNSLWLTVGPDGVDAADLPRILEPVFLDLAPVVLDAPHDPVAAAQVLVDVLADRGLTPAPSTNLGADPIGNAVRGRGVTDLSVATDVANLASGVGARAVVVDGTAVHDAGGSDVQELAYVTAAGAAYLRALVGSGVDVDTAASLLEFRLAATDEQFPTIAKFRAARRLWARVAELSGVSGAAAGQVQHAVTSRPMMSAYDPYVNMLRTTVAGFAAGVGGATSVTVLPFDEPLGLPEVFSRRIARNTSSLLISEAHVAKVTDPAGGSHVTEKLTDDVARAAWEAFGAIESAGGVVAAIADGTIAAGIERTVSERALQIATRERPITGVSEFPNLAEVKPERRPYPTAPAVHRYGVEFEQMRDAPASTPVFLATMGPIAAHTARATFAANLFAAGGIDTVAAGATSGTAEVLAAYDGAPVVCLTGNDAAYADWGAELVTALRDAGARFVVLAGTADVDADTTVAMGLDALAFLRRTREELTA